MLRAYVRVSSDDQSTDSQRPDIERWIHAYGPGQAVRWYSDEGVKGDAKDRPAHKRLLKEVRKGDTVICWALDRLSREGIVAVLQTVQQFDSQGVRLVSVSEPWADSSNPAAEVVLAVMAWAAQQEKRRILARQRAGIEAAKARGGVFAGGKAGRRVTLTPEKEQACKQLHTAQTPIAEIARTTGLSRQTVYRALGLWTPKEKA